MLLPITLCLTAAAVIINLWLAIRIGKVRHALGVSIGDGGEEALVRRMRAQANFIENTPLTLILIAALELTGKGGTWLAIGGGIFIAGRLAHAIGMDGKFKAGRSIGTATAMLVQLVLAVVAVLAVLGIV